MKKYVFVSIKAYGDLIILLTALKNCNYSQSTIIIGSHLVPLIKSLKYEYNYIVLNIGSEVPAFFDVKVKGIKDGLLSYFELRGKLDKLMVSHNLINHALICDKIRLKEHFLYGKYLVEDVYRPVSNIYKDYADKLNCKYTAKLLPSSDKKEDWIAVFTESRVKKKNIPDATLNKIINLLKKFGIKYKIIKITNKPQVKDSDYLNVYGFESLNMIIKESKAIVSCDSLPVHLSEYFDTPCFVYLRSWNDYWLPPSSFLHHQYDLFDNTQRFELWAKKLSNMSYV